MRHLTLDCIPDRDITPGGAGITTQFLRLPFAA